MQRNASFILAALFALIIGLLSSVFTVDQRQYAVVFQFGEIRTVYSQPGLAFKWPLVQNVRFYDKRILTLDSSEPDLFFTSENNPILVDAYVKWRISNIRKFYISLGGGDEGVAATRISLPLSPPACVRKSVAASCATPSPVSVTTSWPRS